MVKRVKLYTDKDWLWWAYHSQKMSPERIAELSGASQATVYKYLKQYKIIKE